MWKPEDSSAVIQADLSPVFFYCPFNIADSEPIALLISVDKIIRPGYKKSPYQQAKRRQNINKKHLY